MAVENGYTGYTEIDVFGAQVVRPGDADRDGDVDIDDFILISNNFSKVPSSPGLDGDIVVDNIVDVLDFRLWKNDVDATVAALVGNFPVPEPSSVVLAGTFAGGGRARSSSFTLSALPTIQILSSNDPCQKGALYD